MVESRNETQSNITFVNPLNHNHLFNNSYQPGLVTDLKLILQHYQSTDAGSPADPDQSFYASFVHEGLCSTVLHMLHE